VTFPAAPVAPFWPTVDTTLVAPLTAPAAEAPAPATAEPTSPKRLETTGDTVFVVGKSP
jgi:hypothetical protein